MSKETAYDLRDARALIERGWTRGAYARNAQSRKVFISGVGTRAARYCAVGAICAVTGESGRYIAAATALARVIDADYLPAWNDAPERTQAEVLAAFDRAIAAEEAAG